MINSIGILRKVDELGRVVLPAELRQTMGIEIKDALEIYVDDKEIILKKYEPDCILCGNAEDVVSYKGRKICNNCISELAKKFSLYF